MWTPRLLDRALDASIFFSFDRTGFERHARRFDPEDLEVDLAGQRILVTGANSGIGRAAALALAHLGAEVWLLCRSPERGAKALEDLKLASRNETLRLEIVDVSSLASVRGFAERLGDTPVHALINNAGVLPSTRSVTGDGLEMTWATNVVGPFLLTALLRPNLETTRGRVVNVSSGGMYTQKMDLSDVGWDRRQFDGVVAYAQTKRAEVILTEQWAEEFAGTGVTVNSMHPGWADTPAVQEALPRFWKFTQGRLRSPRQGADTMVWLAACPRLGDATGKFFFDRRAVCPYLLPRTRESAKTRRALWAMCRRQAGLE
ncbi:MAG: SDR family NAD(P)-dependent oxidoreductase [Acidobacteriota bacterium]